ncbi:MAG: hypothetical protein HYX65_06290 [Gemmatimonadetes bacterium]|nr:hypothetical protein [Gemmatimonadota bacterium]
MTSDRAPAPAAKADGAAVRGVALWLTIGTVVVIGLALAVRHGSKVTSLLGSTT